MPDVKSQRWQEFYDEYCLDNFGGREPSGAEHDEAAAYADQAEEEWEAEHADEIDRRFDEDEI